MGIFKKSPKKSPKKKPDPSPSPAPKSNIFGYGDIFDVTVKKETADQLLGISFGRRGAEGLFYVTNLAEDGLFHDTELAVGHRLLKINESEVTGKETSEVLSLLKENDDVVVQAQAEGQCTGKILTATAKKETIDQSLGISFKCHDPNGSVYLSKILEDGLFANSVLGVGQRILKVNDIEVTGKPFKEVLDIMKQSEEVTIEVQAAKQLGEDAENNDQEAENTTEGEEETKEDNSLFNTLFGWCA